MQGRTAFIDGPRRLRGANVAMPDIRAGAALVVAALCADGTTTLRDAWHIERGYEDMAGKLRSLGAEVELVAEGTAAARGGVTYE
jgi:UDP-N-acetylglucosamine 1-carboxyvinyltransferase